MGSAPPAPCAPAPPAHADLYACVAGCVIFLEYEPDSYERTVMLVGKVRQGVWCVCVCVCSSVMTRRVIGPQGVTYDTGGCDIKAGGVMAGMSRDKCGAAAVVGFLKVS